MNNEFLNIQISGVFDNLRIKYRQSRGEGKYELFDPKDIDIKSLVILKKYIDLLLAPDKRSITNKWFYNPFSKTLSMSSFDTNYFDENDIMEDDFSVIDKLSPNFLNQINENYEVMFEKYKEALHYVKFPDEMLTYQIDAKFTDNDERIFLVEEFRSKIVENPDVPAVDKEFKVRTLQSYHDVSIIDNKLVHRECNFAQTKLDSNIGDGTGYIDHYSTFEDASKSYHCCFQPINEVILFDGLKEDDTLKNIFLKKRSNENDDNKGFKTK